jgi:hypothetical protein
VKNLDLDDELEDYDGGNDYGDDDAGSYGTSAYSAVLRLFTNA